MIFSIPDKIFYGNHSLFAQTLKVDKQLEHLVERLSKKEWKERAQKFYRPDFLLTTTGLRMVENNIDTNLGGIGLCDAVIAEFQTRANIAPHFLQEKNLNYFSVDKQWSKTLRTLLNAKKTSAGKKPVFFSAYHSNAADPENDFTTSGYNACIINNGFTLLCGPIADLSINENNITYQGVEIDIVYTDFSFPEFLENHQPLSIIDALINADERGQVLYLSPPASMMYDNKAILSFLTNEEYKEFFNVEEWSRLAQLIPHTHIVNEQSLEYCLQNRENLVLKPGFDFGGRNVFFGAELDATQWSTMIKEAMTTVLPTVVQEVVTDQVKIYDSETSNFFHFCLSPLFFNNEFAGCLYRESNEPDAQNPIINASRGSKFSSIYVKIS